MKLDANNSLQCIAPLAAVALGAWLGIVFCDWLVPAVGERISAASGEGGRGIAEVEELPTVSPRKVRSECRIYDMWTGPRRRGAFRVAGIGSDGSIDARGIDAQSVRNGLVETFRRALRKRGKAPLSQRYARRAQDPFDTPEARRQRSGGSSGDKTPQGIYEGDVYISGLPMVDQGNSAYCAVASAARVLQGYGIEVTMDDLVELARSSACCGTSSRSWDAAMWKVANEHGMRLETVFPMTEVAQPLSQLLIEYNQAAYTLDASPLVVSDYTWGWYENYAAFDMDREYEVQREALLANQGKGKAFAENVVDRVDDSDPLFWQVLLGDVPEATADGGLSLNASRSTHMRLIIGYNEQRDEVLYTDSWGEGHELKRMDASDALSITTGLFYLADAHDHGTLETVAPADE